MTDQTRLTDRGLDDLVPESHAILDRVQDELYPDEADTELPLCVDCEARDP